MLSKSLANKALECVIIRNLGEVRFSMDVRAEINVLIVLLLCLFIIAIVVFILNIPPYRS